MMSFMGSAKMYRIADPVHLKPGSYPDRNPPPDQCCGTVIIYYGSGSGSGSDFWKVMVPVPVPVPAPYLDHKKPIWKKKFAIFFYFLLIKLFYKEKS